MTETVSHSELSAMVIIKLHYLKRIKQRSILSLPEMSTTVSPLSKTQLLLYTVDHFFILITTTRS